MKKKEFKSFNLFSKLKKLKYFANFKSHVKKKNDSLFFLLHSYL